MEAQVQRLRPCPGRGDGHASPALGTPAEVAGGGEMPWTNQGRAGFHGKRRQGEMLGVGRPEKEEGENRV